MTVPERMTAEERFYVNELLAGTLLEGFRTLLNSETAKAMAQFCTDKIATMQAYSGKQL